MTPRPPNWINAMMMDCPVGLKRVEMSMLARPVTHTAEVEVNRASYQTLLQVPGIGVTSARRIIAARRGGILDFADLTRMGVVMKRAVYFVTCKGKMMYRINMNENSLMNYLVDDKNRFLLTKEGVQYEQLSLFDFGIGGNT